MDPRHRSHLAAWRLHVVAAVTQRLGYKAVALFLAAALWLFIHR
jgi:hypothetical protein